jgi:hypothetical protein
MLLAFLIGSLLQTNGQKFMLLFSNPPKKFVGFHYDVWMDDDNFLKTAFNYFNLNQM